MVHMELWPQMSFFSIEQHLKIEENFVSKCIVIFKNFILVVKNTPQVTALCVYVFVCVWHDFNFWPAYQPFLVIYSCSLSAFSDNFDKMWLWWPNMFKKALAGQWLMYWRRLHYQKSVCQRKDFHCSGKILRCSVQCVREIVNTCTKCN